MANKKSECYAAKLVDELTGNAEAFADPENDDFMEDESIQDRAKTQHTKVTKY